MVSGILLAITSNFRVIKILIAQREEIDTFLSQADGKPQIDFRGISTGGIIGLSGYPA